MPSTSAESGLEFVDANVLVYAEDTSAGAKRDTALELVNRLWEERRGCLSVQVLQEFFVTVTRKVAKPLAEEAAEQRVRDLALWTCFSPTASDVVAAIGLSRAHRLSFWDAMIVERRTARRRHALVRGSPVRSTDPRRRDRQPVRGITLTPGLGRRQKTRRARPGLPAAPVSYPLSGCLTVRAG